MPLHLTNNGTRIKFGGLTIASPFVFNDWFLPSRNELKEMYFELNQEGVGNFQELPYWSSTEFSNYQAYTYGFGNGVSVGSNKNSQWRIRACRTFTDEIGAYSLRDTGPAGGLIFIVDGTTYYESAPQDQNGGAGLQWSNLLTTEVGEEAQGLDIGDGLSNTIAIINQPGHINSPAKICYDLVIQVY